MIENLFVLHRFVKSFVVFMTWSNCMVFKTEGEQGWPGMKTITAMIVLHFPVWNYMWSWVYSLVLFLVPMDSLFFIPIWFESMIPRRNMNRLVKKFDKHDLNIFANFNLFDNSERKKYQLAWNSLNSCYGVLAIGNCFECMTTSLP